jgi:hypothetical protein
LAAAGARSVNLDLPLATVLMNPRHEWARIASGTSRLRTARDLDVDWKTYNQDDYLMSHCTILSSVGVKDDGHTILPACTELVNNNGNAWTNQVTLATFRTFVGGDNFLEHLQIKELSKGRILDAVVRPVKYEDKKGRKADVYFVDILVATSRKHSDLVSKIASGKLTTMSMGCLADEITCSRCGKVLGDGQGNCKHLDNQMLQEYKDKDGDVTVVAELCGSMKRKGGVWVANAKSVKFIEASWVEKPAFTGAVLNHYVSDVSKEAAEVLRFPAWKLAETVDSLFKMRVADRAGMVVLRVARAEMMRRKREAVAERLVRR